MTKDIIVYDSVDQLRIISNPTAWKIMQLLSSRPMYTAQVAKELGIYEQSAYYYTRKLNSIGAIDDVGTALIRGGTAKLFQSTCPSFGIEMDWGERQSEITIDHENKEYYAKDFFHEFIANDFFNGLIVVGAPGPHGPYRSSARDGHYAVQLAF